VVTRVGREDFVGEDGRLDGARVAGVVREEIRRETARWAAVKGRPPGLAVILVGEHPASLAYVRGKTRAAEDVGIRAVTHRFPRDADADAVMARIDALNHDATVDGILVQLPLPAHLDEDLVLGAVAPPKDVDGLTPSSLGRLMAGLKGFQPCTPRGVMELLRRVDEPLDGRTVAVIGRSRLVGLPLAVLLTRAHATVTVCHSHTRDLPEIVRRADIVVAAAGSPGLVRPEWVHPEQVVIDVGITRTENGLVGDVDPGVYPVVRLYTPVPGGVGPMTVAMLLLNTLEGYRAT
jgi:methylenetetrahydrofolate dehydrogenase (NADP+)/methenyltetrahydrofolate cyclohydrolase